MAASLLWKEGFRQIALEANWLYERREQRTASPAPPSQITSSVLPSVWSPDGFQRGSEGQNRPPTFTVKNLTHRKHFSETKNVLFETKKSKLHPCFERDFPSISCLKTAVVKQSTDTLLFNCKKSWVLSNEYARCTLKECVSGRVFVSLEILLLHSYLLLLTHFLFSRLRSFLPETIQAHISTDN